MTPEGDVLRTLDVCGAHLENDEANVKSEQVEMEDCHHLTFDAYDEGVLRGTSWPTRPDDQ
jgi:hypothetical protein